MPDPVGSYEIICASGAPNNTRIKVTAKARDGTTYEDTFNFSLNASQVVMRDTILAGLQTNGWTVSGTAPPSIPVRLSAVPPRRGR